jgi:hypothetical protein
MDSPRKKIRTDPVHLIDKSDSGDTVLVCLAPHRLGLRLDASHRAEHGNRTIENTQRPLHLDRKIDVPRRIDNIDTVIPP